jgi:hypothetical protein
MAFEVIRKTAGKRAQAASSDAGFTHAGYTQIGFTQTEFTWEAAKARLAGLASGGINIAYVLSAQRLGRGWRRARVRPSVPVGAVLAHVEVAGEAGGDPEQPSAPPESPPTAPVELPPEPPPEPPGTPEPEIPVAPPVEAPDIPPPEIPSDTSQGMTAPA